MNADRRKRLTAISDKLAALREEIGDIKGEEENARDNLPESLQCSEKADAMTEAADAMDSAISDLETAADNLATAAGNL